MVEGKDNIAPELRPLIIEMWTRLLDSEASGNDWDAESVTLRYAEVPIASVRKLRDAAMAALFEMFDTAADDDERRRVFFALDNASRTATRGGPSNELLRQSIIDHIRIVRFFTERTEELSYELREKIEHSALFDHYRTLDLVGDTRPELGCQTEAAELVEAIIAMRDRFNEDPTFQRYKILVGFEGVMPFQWDERDYDPEEVEKYRDKQIAAMLNDISDENADEWLGFLERCAATRSNDMATFPKLSEFIVQLSNSRPVIAEYLLENGNADLLQFLPAFLKGLYSSDRGDLYRRMLTAFMAKGGNHLLSIAIHWKSSAPDDPAALTELFRRSLAADSRAAIAECLVFILQHFPEKVPDNDALFRPALRYLIQKKTPNWVRLAWLPKKTPIFEDLGAHDASLLLESLMQLVKIEYQTEILLGHVAHRHLGLVWDFLAGRFDNSYGTGGEEFRYEAIPYRLQKLIPVLSSNVMLAVEKVASWFEKDSALFAYRGGRLLAQVFPRCDDEFADALILRIEGGDLNDAKFVLAVMQNFHGETPTHRVLKAALIKFPDNENISDRVVRSIENTGVVHGEFGFVESLRGKKALIEPWLEDGHPVVTDFAKRLMGEIDRAIASEKRRADTRSALRKLDYDNEGVIDED
jgi:hypothetical protein